MKSIIKSNSNRPRNRLKDTSKIQSSSKMNYYRSRPKPVFESKKGSRWTLKRAIRIISSGMFIIFFIFVVGYSLILNKVANISVDSTEYRQKSVYQTYIAEQLNSVSYRLKLTFDEKKLEKSLLKQFPEIQKIDINLPFYSKKPKINIHISTPAFILVSPGADPGNGLVVAANSKAVGKVSTISKLQQLQVVTDGSGVEFKPGDITVGENATKFILAVVNQLKDSKIPVSSLELAKNSPELDIRTSDKPYYVRLLLSGDPSQQLGQYLASRDQLIKSNITPSKYLDVRVSGKVYYQ